MALRKSELMLTELSDFLDTLPQKPCDRLPPTRYFCTICERLNKPVQNRCQLYKSRMDSVGLSSTDLSAPSLSLSSPSSPLELPPARAEDLKDSKDESVEFKVVGDRSPSSDMPMFEIVKPAAEDAEPLEMTLLEKEAVEFELMNDDAISEDALEVEPIEIEDEYEDDFEGIEVEPIEVEELEEEVSESSSPFPESSTFKPIEAPEDTSAPKPVIAAPKKPKAVKKARKKVVKPASTPKAVPQPASAKSPKPVVSAAKMPTPASPKPVATSSPTPAVAPQPQATTQSVINDIEAQLVIGQPCTICKSPLTNPKFCTQCGAQVEITPQGIKTVPRA